MAHMLCACPQLRLDKVSELIHNSTDHRNVQTARVSVFFEEIIDKVPCPHRSNLPSCCMLWARVPALCMIALY
jgi:hypothetical protein